MVSTKKKVLLDGEILNESKSMANDYSYGFKIGKHLIKCMQYQGDRFHLFIDNCRFGHLMKEEKTGNYCNMKNPNEKTAKNNQQEKKEGNWGHYYENKFNKNDYETKYEKNDDFFKGNPDEDFDFSGGTSNANGNKNGFSKGNFTFGVKETKRNDPSEGQNILSFDDIAAITQAQKANKNNSDEVENNKEKFKNIGLDDNPMKDFNEFFGSKPVENVDFRTDSQRFEDLQKNLMQNAYGNNQQQQNSAFFDFTHNPRAL